MEYRIPNTYPYDDGIIDLHSYSLTIFIISCGLKYHLKALPFLPLPQTQTIILITFSSLLWKILLHLQANCEMGCVCVLYFSSLGWIFLNNSFYLHFTKVFSFF